MFLDHKSLKYIFTQRDLNMRQRKWMKYLEDFEFTLHYDEYTLYSFYQYVLIIFLIVLLYKYVI